jgi:hypothetical protein
MRRPAPGRAPQTAQELSGPDAPCILQERPPPGDPHHSRSYVRPPSPHRGGRGVSCSGPGQPPAPLAVGHRPTGPPAYGLERPWALVQALPTPDGAGAACQLSRGGERPGHGRLPLGHRPRSSARRPRRTMGREAAPGWRHPRHRDAAARNPRASIAAGARRTDVRWDPTHGDPRDQPSRCLAPSRPMVKVYSGG